MLRIVINAEELEEPSVVSTLPSVTSLASSESSPIWLVSILLMIPSMSLVTCVWVEASCSFLISASLLFWLYSFFFRSIFAVSI